MISVTMYNEEPKDLERTLKGVKDFLRSSNNFLIPLGICRNIDSFVVNKKSKQAWRQIQVVIVSDGRRQCNTETLDYLEELGVFNYRLMNDVLEVSVALLFRFSHIWSSTGVRSWLSPSS